MRTTHSVRNITIGIFAQVIITILGFVSRKVFIDNLGVDYLGVNGLLTNVISTLALVEGGIGASIVYNLYKPLAENNKEKVIALVQLYKKAYLILAIIVFFISLFLYPFLGLLMKNAGNISDVSIIYFIFVVKSMVSYLNAHKWSLINADQRGYLLTQMNLGFQVFSTIAKIIVLTTTQDYVLYLIIEFIIFAIQNIVNGRIVTDRYPYIKTKQSYKLDKVTMDNIVMNVKALFFHNIGYYLVFSTDNLLISTFISVATVGLYSNYLMITQQLASLLKPVLGGIGNSVGNLLATESGGKNYFIFKVIYLVNFWIYSFSVIFLYNLLEPFIGWWLGSNYLLGKLSLILILINFFLTGMRTSVDTFKAKAGLFVQDKYIPLIEGLINLVSALLLIKYLGLAGVFLGTTISTILTVFWIPPYIVYKNLFQKSVWSYFMTYGFFAILTLITCLITTIMCRILVGGNGFSDLVLRGIICLVIPNLIYLAIFFKNQEFKYIKNVFTIQLSGLKAKLTSAN